MRLYLLWSIKRQTEIMSFGRWAKSRPRDFLHRTFLISSWDHSIPFVRIRFATLSNQSLFWILCENLSGYSRKLGQMPLCLLDQQIRRSQIRNFSRFYTQFTFQELFQFCQASDLSFLFKTTETFWFHGSQNESGN
jgi:hypothetical protein